MQDSIEAKLIKLSERLSEIEKQLIEESSTLNQDDLISLNCSLLDNPKIIPFTKFW